MNEARNHKWSGLWRVCVHCGAVFSNPQERNGQCLTPQDRVNAALDEARVATRKQREQERAAESVSATVRGMVLR